ncbi:MAG TPA: hypothetical protein VK530_14490, partial [Candidatus Acidoferrum sp.]|nr:hypothetical protein [Candidatus Acidoferrum sp.]
MPSPPRFVPFAVILSAILGQCLCAAADFERIGVAALLREQPLLTGSGIFVGQTEAEEVEGSGRWQVNPDYPTVSQPASLFTWISSSGTASTFPNEVGVESG